MTVPSVGFNSPVSADAAAGSLVEECSPGEWRPARRYLRTILLTTSCARSWPLTPSAVRLVRSILSSGLRKTFVTFPRTVNRPSRRYSAVLSGKNSEPRCPAEIVARRVVEARKSLGWTQAKFAERLREIGYVKSRSTLTKLEGGQYRGVSVDDLFALAAALGVAPVHLLVPLEDDATVAVAPRVNFPAPLARAWIRGTASPPMLPDVDLRQIPESELIQLVRRSLTRDMNNVTAALMADELEASARRIAKEIRNPRRENDGS